MLPSVQQTQTLQITWRIKNIFGNLSSCYKKVKNKKKNAGIPKGGKQNYLQQFLVSSFPGFFIPQENYMI